MWEYRWADVPAGSGECAELTRLGADGWEAVGMESSGEHLGKSWVRVLLKRPAHARVIDLTEDPSPADAAPHDLTELAPRTF